MGKPKTQSFIQYQIEHGITDDPLVGILALDSPSGKISNRAMTIAKKRLLNESSAYFQCLSDYRDEIDAGTILDPTGEYKPTLSPTTKKVDLSNPPNTVLALRVKVEKHPRSKKYKQALIEAEERWKSGQG